MKSSEFKHRRRQPYLNEQSYENTLRWFDNDYEFLDQKLREAQRPEEKASALSSKAFRYWNTFQLRLTAGDSLDELATYLTQVVEAFEEWVDALDALSDAEYDPPFVLKDVIDTYIDYLNLLSAAILLHREDLIPRICALNEGTDFDKSDAVIEDLFGFYLPDRPILDGWYWKAYTPLLEAIDQEAPADEMVYPRDMIDYARSMPRNTRIERIEKTI